MAKQIKQQVSSNIMNIYQVDIHYKDQVQSSKFEGKDEESAKMSAMLWAVETLKLPATKIAVKVHPAQ